MADDSYSNVYTIVAVLVIVFLIILLAVYYGGYCSKEDECQDNTRRDQVKSYIRHRSSSSPERSSVTSSPPSKSTHDDCKEDNDTTISELYRSNFNNKGGL